MIKSIPPGQKFLKIHKLDRAHYQQWTGKISAIPFNTHFAQAVLDDKADGMVFVNKLVEPDYIYISHSYGMSLLYWDGKSDDFVRNLLDYLVSANGLPQDNYLQISSPLGQQKFEEIFADRIIISEAMPEEPAIGKILKHIRVNFRFDLENYKNNATDIRYENYDIREFTAASFESFTGSVIPQFFWRSAEEFDKYGKAYAVYANGEIASVAFTSFGSEKILELGIETLPVYRGRGLAKIACFKLIEYALDHGMIPVWACRKGNIGSYKLAGQLGFEMALELPYYQIKINQ